jgi:hypothetical protein
MYGACELRLSWQIGEVLVQVAASLDPVTAVMAAVWALYVTGLVPNAAPHVADTVHVELQRLPWAALQVRTDELDQMAAVLQTTSLMTSSPASPGHFLFVAHVLSTVGWSWHPAAAPADAEPRYYAQLLAVFVQLITHGALACVRTRVQLSA